MGVKDKKKIRKLAQRDLEPVEKDIKSGPSEMRKRKREKENNGDSRKVVHISIEDNSHKAANDKQRTKKVRKGKVKKVKNYQGLDGQHDPSNTDGFKELSDNEAMDDQSQFKIKGESGSAEMVPNEDDCKSKNARKKKKKDQNFLDDLEKRVEAVQVEPCHLFPMDESCLRENTSISKKSRKKKRRDMHSSNSMKSLEKKEQANQEDVYLISSEDEGSPKGMKKWIMEYQQNRPGLKVLQQRIDEFIIAHEAKLEQERKEREALSAEEGWQLVQHHKGRKKTKDADGITVGSVAQAVIESKRAKKKNTDVGLDFYRFQRKEAQRNEIMMLQSKFEQDKKRIQQIRAARKFKPY
ncbi:uncharacterized protein LOC126799637 [Argentina anserina]|uniref:uncharacterized protein LOC126799637 n=1 Tax=Argentina anserina TaxID=57926 RepID=UPI0021766E9A|nr:uncharacterized protein LOC126799637 [Potentilla anserina]